MYDLLIQNGHVVDPHQGFDAVFDIAIKDGCIAAVMPQIPAQHALSVVEARGKVVTPGLIDIHIHAADHDESINAEVDTVGIHMAVTTAVDAGSTGVLDFPGYRKLVEGTAKTRILFIPVTSLVFNFAGNFMGLKVGSDLSPDNYDLRKTAALYERHQDVIVGFKCIAPLKEPSDTESLPLKYSKEITRSIGVPLTVHLGWVPYRPWLDTPSILEKLDAGDIATHIFRRQGSVFDANNQVDSRVFAAQEKGVLFDIGHGTGNFDFDVARRAIDQGIRPFTISSDVMDKSSITGPVFSLAETMTKFLYLGFTLSEVVAMTTYNAARAINRESELGTLAVGRVADVSILNYQEGNWKLNDGIHVVQWEGRKLIPQYAVKSGELIPCQYPENSLRKAETAAIAQ